MAFLTPPTHWFSRKNPSIEPNASHIFLAWKACRSMRRATNAKRVSLVRPIRVALAISYAQHLFFLKRWWIKCTLVIAFFKDFNPFCFWIHDFPGIHCVLLFQREQVSRVSTLQAAWDCYLRQLCSPILVLSGCHKLVPCVLPAPEDGGKSTGKICHPGVCFKKTLPETNSSPLKIGRNPKTEGSSPNHPFYRFDVSFREL